MDYKWILLLTCVGYGARYIFIQPHPKILIVICMKYSFIYRLLCNDLLLTYMCIVYKAVRADTITGANRIYRDGLCVPKHRNPTSVQRDAPEARICPI